MASHEMIKRAYAEGAYAALKEAGYDHQTAVHYAVDMAKQATGEDISNTASNLVTQNTEANRAAQQTPQRMARLQQLGRFNRPKPAQAAATGGGGIGGRPSGVSPGF